MCNGIIHGRDTAEAIQLKRRYVIQDLTAIYESRDQLLPRDRDIVMESVEVHAQKTTRQIRNWITNTYIPANDYYPQHPNSNTIRNLRCQIYTIILQDQTNVTTRTSNMLRASAPVSVIGTDVPS